MQGPEAVDPQALDGWMTFLSNMAMETTSKAEGCRKQEESQAMAREVRSILSMQKDKAG